LEHREQRKDVVGDLPLVAPQGRESRFQVLLDGKQGKDLAALRHIGDASTCPLVRPQPSEIEPIEGDRAAPDRMVTDHRAQQAGLADAVAAEHASYLAGLCLQRDGAQRLGGAIVEIDSVHIEHELHRPK
jgi:hypothetical protein